MIPLSALANVSGAIGVLALVASILIACLIGWSIASKD